MHSLHSCFIVRKLKGSSNAEVFKLEVGGKKNGLFIEWLPNLHT